MSYSSDQGLDRLIWQYRDSPNVRALIVSALSEFDDIGSAIVGLRTRLDIDVATGAQLDGIGEIVGVLRPSSTPVLADEIFEFDGGTGLGFSGVDDPTVGGKFIGVDGAFLGPMTDHDYRRVLRAAISANVGLSTFDHLAEYCRIVLGADAFLGGGIGFVNVTVARPVSQFEINLLRASIPVAAGIRIGYIAASGYDDENGGFAFGGVSAPDSGIGGFDDVAGSSSEFSGGFVGIVG